MKAYVVQPPYSMSGDGEENFRALSEILNSIGPEADLIVLPEGADTPSRCADLAAEEAMVARYNAALREKCAETAVRCGAVVCANMREFTPTGRRNSTVVFSKDGSVAGRYDKQHLVPSEMSESKLDSGYTYSFSPPYILELDGVRYAFLICYDNYFYEMFANIARYNPDVIVVCSHQRSDTHDALETMTKFCAYNCNAYIVRASVSLGEDSPVGGCSMIAGPDGRVLVNMKNGVGCASAEFDPHRRYLKPAGFGNPDATHHSYIETGRRPWKYRIGGGAIVPYDEVMPYPRVCSHRGWGTVAPENSLPAFGAAVALGAEEIEFDLWATKDGEIVSIHDCNLERVSDGRGFVWDYTLEELRRLDFGSVYSPVYEGLRIPTLAEILAKFSGHAVMNIHIKSDGRDMPTDDTLRRIVKLLYDYDAARHCYCLCDGRGMEALRRIAPEIPLCAGADEQYSDLVDKALCYGAKKIQLFKPHFEHYGPGYLEEIIPRAHAAGLRVNYFWSDDPAETRRVLDLGVDTVLTNDYLRNSLKAVGR